LASFGIGAKLRQERVGKGLGIDDISRDTRIAPRFLEAIETDDYSSLPGLVFTRNFVRQYALTLQLDPDPLLAELPKQDESTAPLPVPPARLRSSYYTDRRLHSILYSMVWLLLAGGAGLAAYKHFNHSIHAASPPLSGTDASVTPAAPTAEPPLQTAAIEQTAQATGGTIPAPEPSVVQSSEAPSSSATAPPVHVSLSAHEDTWIQVTADGKIAFTGTLKPNETKEISAAEQVKVLTGNAGGLDISLNGKALGSLGPLGQVREVRLTAEGPQFLSKAPPPAPDPL
jgi:cytoskeleton protein RodZ